MFALMQRLKRDLPPLPVAVLFSLGLHLIAGLLLLNCLLQAVPSSRLKPQSSLQVSLRGATTENDSASFRGAGAPLIEAAPLVESSVLPPAESSQLPQIEPNIVEQVVYWPRSKLSVVPQLQTPIALFYPDDFEPQQAHYETILTVYINEYGQVDRVELEDSDFPAALASAAISAFQSARYQAGARDEQAVKARIRIAISFDTLIDTTTSSDEQSLN